MYLGEQTAWSASFIEVKGRALAYAAAAFVVSCSSTSPTVTQSASTTAPGVITIFTTTTTMPATTTMSATTTTSALTECQAFVLDNLWETMGLLDATRHFVIPLALEEARVKWEIALVEMEDQTQALRENAADLRTDAEDLEDLVPSSPEYLVQDVQLLAEAAHLYADAGTMAANALDRLDPELLEDAQRHLDEAALVHDRVDIRC